MAFVAQKNFPVTTSGLRTGRFFLVDNDKLWGDSDGLFVLTSKLRSENGPKLKGPFMTGDYTELPDIIDPDYNITPTGLELGASLGVLESSAATFYGVRTSSFSFTLTSGAFTIAVHNKVMKYNSRGYLVDLNNLAWYLVFKGFGAPIFISTSDYSLNRSTKTLRRLR